MRLIVGNWKMYPTLTDSLVLAASLKKAAEGLSGVEVVTAPPTSWLVPVIESWAGAKSAPKLAAQNIWPDDQGAFTGETSAYFLKDLVDYAIVGHSERRRLIGERNDQVHEKVQACLRWQIRPILCIGEVKKIYDSRGATDDHQLRRLIGQLADGLYAVKESQLDRIVVAYEPVWAVGTHHPAKPEDVERVGELIRRYLSDKYGETAKTVPILYGGSVEPNNAADYLVLPQISGLLIGSISVKAKSFIEVCRIAAGLRHK